MALQTNRPNRLGGVGIFLFGLVFLGAGLAVGYFFALSDIRLWLTARDYVPVQAELLDVQLQSSSGKTTTYKVQARYRYTLRDRSYVADRVGISSGSDNVGSYQQDLYSRLHDAQQRHMAVDAWADPASPGDALLDRDMRWGLFMLKFIFFFVFSLAGAGIITIALTTTSGAETSSGTGLSMNSASRDRRTISSPRGAVIQMWFFAVLWNAISFPILIFLPDELAKRHWIVLIGLLFPLAGTWLVYLAATKTLEWRRFGALAVTLDPFPPRLGSTVSGTLDIPQRFVATTSFALKLTCVHRQTTQNRGERDVSENAIWQDDVTVHPEPTGRGSRLSFRFTAPATLPATESPSDNYHYWSLHVAASLPGVDLDRSFEIPMVPGEEGAAVAVAAPISITTPPDIPTNIVRISNLGGVTTFYYPLCRYPTMSITLIIVGLFFSGVTAFMYSQTGHGIADIMLWLMILIFGLVGGVILLLGLYTLLNTLRVEVSSHGLDVTRRFLGMSFRSHIPPDEIAAIDLRIGAQSKSGNDFRVRYTLAMTIRNSKRRITVGEDIPDRHLADYLAQRLRDLCGIRATTT